jgi:hypothetical protein
MSASTFMDHAPESITVDTSEAMTPEEVRGYAKVLDCYAVVLGITKDDILRDMVRLNAVGNRRTAAEVLSQLR